MARLIESLSVSGSRKADGTVNASGQVFLYQPGTTSQAVGYRDDDLSEAWTTTSGAIVLDAAGKADIWVNDPVDVVIKDSSGTVLDTLLGFNKVRAEQVEVENDGYTGAITAESGAVSQGLGGKTDLDTILTSAYDSIGPDFQVLESAGATPVNIVDFLREVWISVTQFDADPSGVGDSTSAIQQTMNRAKALGGGVVYFPPGTYKVSSALSLTSATGVAFVGAGVSVSKITMTSTSANIFTLSSCTSTTFEGLGLSATATNSGSAISLSSCTRVTLRQVLVNTAGGGTFLIPVVADTNAGYLRLDDCELTAKAADATARALKLTSCSGVLVTGGIYSGLAGAAMEFAGSTSFVRVVAAGFGNASANIGILWTAGMTGTDFTVVGCPTLRSAAGTVTTPFDLSALSTNPRLRQWGNEVDGYTSAQASGGGGGSSFTPDWTRGPEIRLSLTSGGAAVCTINVPALTPSTVMRDVRLILRLTAAAGGNITWTFPAAYILVGGGTTITGVDGTTTIVEFQWDADTSEYRECYRSATTT